MRYFNPIWIYLLVKEQINSVIVGIKSVKGLTAGRVLVLIQVASLRSARQAHALAQNKRKRKEIHQSRTEAELCAKPLAQISALSVGG